MGKWAWVKTISENRQTIFKLIEEGLEGWWRGQKQSLPPLPVANSQ
jgi:hypothetical protein